MQFMADVHLTCDECNGNRFKDEVLEVKFKNKNISEVLQMTVEEDWLFQWRHHALQKNKS